MTTKQRVIVTLTTGAKVELVYFHKVYDHLSEWFQTTTDGVFVNRYIDEDGVKHSTHLCRKAILIIEAIIQQ